VPATGITEPCGFMPCNYSDCHAVIECSFLILRLKKKSHRDSAVRLEG